MKIVCIGSGNVATHMAQAFNARGINVVQVFSRDLSHAELLAQKTAAQAIADLSLIRRDADLYVIAVKDDAITEIAQSLEGVAGLVLHTSGATDIQVLKNCKRYGVLYPLQTFSKSRAIDFSNVPLFIEAGNQAVFSDLKLIADQLSHRVYEADSEKRRVLHLAAVFACNFVNQLYTLSADLVEHHGLEFEMLRPLILETALKVQSAEPVNVQTGPAVRGDQQTMMNHLDLLTLTPELQGIYETLSNSIKKTHS